MKRFGPPVVYRGVTMRSRLEARIACVLDLFKVEWDYEPLDVALGAQKFYRPDFWLPQSRTWLEGKCEVRLMDPDDVQRLEMFFSWANARDEDVAVIFGHGESLLVRDDLDWERFLDDSPGFCRQHWVTAGLRTCPGCKLWHVGRANQSTDEVCRICGHRKRLTEMVFAVELFAVQGRICPDSDWVVPDASGRWVAGPETGPMFVGQRYNLDSYRVIQDFASNYPPTEHCSDMCQAIEHFEVSDREPAMPPASDGESAMRDYMVKHAQWSLRFEDAIASVYGGRPTYEVWEEATGKADHRRLLASGVFPNKNGEWPAR